MAKVASTRVYSDKQLKITNNTSKMVLWGQQCSSTCGCAIRFEIEVDDRDRILGASYFAKTVVATQSKQKNSGAYYLKPVKTTRKNQPLLKSCQCPTVNTLAQQVVTTLHQTPPLHLSSAQNMLECVGVRSSIATRSVALSNLECSPTDLHCFDVLEEALTACLKGYMPRSRHHHATKQADLEAEERPEKFGAGNEPVNPLRYVQAAKRAGKTFPRMSMKDSSISSMPAFHLQELNTEEENGNFSQSTTLKQLCTDLVKLEKEKVEIESDSITIESNILDWQNYVDEKFGLESSEN